MLRTIEEQKTRIVELDLGKAWLEEQWTAWKEIAEGRERSIQELKVWIDQLEAGKSWLEKDRNYWKDLAEKRSNWLSGLLLRIAKQFSPRRITAESPSSPHATLGAESSPSNWPIQPTGREWGNNQGTPVDQYYVEKFLEKHSADIRGAVLEIGSKAFTLHDGGSLVEKSVILNSSEGTPLANILTDLSQADHFPSNQFDCIIFTHTLQFIYDLHSALNILRRILKPDGVLLATFPGISRSNIQEPAGSRYWGLTCNSAKRLLGEVFQPSNVIVEGWGNILTTSAYLYGLSAQELRQQDLEYRDPQFDLVITARAQKDQLAEAEKHSLVSSGKTNASGGSMGDRALVLLYHRISPPASDPWSLNVTPEHFDDHLQTIREMGTPIDLDELSDRPSTGNLPPRAIAVTFDDGYADTLSHARPLLEKHEVPATVFIPTAVLTETREYWWDELERILLQPGTLPRILELSIDQLSFQWDLGEASVYTREAFEHSLSWRSGQPTSGLRQSMYVELWELLHPLDPRQIHEVIEKILVWAGIDPTPRQTHRALTRSEAISLKSDPWLKFGSHGVKHASLASLPVKAQDWELRESKTTLEAATGKIITSLAYPYGNPQDYSIVTAALAREAGYKMAFINSPGVVDQNADLFLLPRCYVEDWDKDEFSRRLHHWMEE